MVQVVSIAPMPPWAWEYGRLEDEADPPIQILSEAPQVSCRSRLYARSPAACQSSLSSPAHRGG